MKYFYDTEFLEGSQRRRFLGIPFGNTPPTIDLISIGIVDEDGREFYAISSEFNLEEAWNRYDLKVNKAFPSGPEYNRVYWIRENVLKPIFYGWAGKDVNFHELDNFTYKNFKNLLKKHGKTRAEIAKGVVNFITPDLETSYNTEEGESQPELYGYYADYDHVTLCWLFGKMIDLPKGFPMYTKDLKQIIGDKKLLPSSKNAHNALEDARWNKKLYDMIINGGRMTGKTTKLVNEAIEFLFENKFVYIADSDFIEKNFVGLNRQHRESAMKFIDPDYKTSKNSQKDFKERFIKRLSFEHAGMFTTNDNRLFKIK